MAVATFARPPTADVTYGAELRKFRFRYRRATNMRLLESTVHRSHAYRDSCTEVDRSDLRARTPASFG